MIQSPRSRCCGFNLLKTLSGIETVVSTWRTGILLKLQPTQNPFRDWNEQAGKIAFGAGCFNLLKTLSGIETIRRALEPDWDVRLQPTQNPFRDWNFLWANSWLQACRLQPTQNPFRDWNGGNIGESGFRWGFNLLKTLSGIETSIFAICFSSTSRFNLLKTLSGIETRFALLTSRAFWASTYSKPFQGLKPGHIICLIGADDALQPTQNPFRDWNKTAFAFNQVTGAASTYSKPFQGLKPQPLDRGC